MLEQLKSFNAQRAQLEELIELSAFGRSFTAECEKHNVEVPSWVTVQMKTLAREIATRNADAIEAQKAALKNKLNALKTPDERRKELQEKLEKLEGVAS